MNDCHIMLGSEYEPTILPHFEDLLKLVIKRNWQVDFHNCTKLHLYDQNILKDVPFHVFNASFDGFQKRPLSTHEKTQNTKSLKKMSLKQLILLDQLEPSRQSMPLWCGLILTKP